MRSLLVGTVFLIESLVFTVPAGADTSWRIPDYSSYVEFSDGTVLCGDKYDSWHEGRTGNVCAGGQYDSWHEGRTGEVACGGRYTGFHKSSTGKVCFGGLYHTASFSNPNSSAPGPKKNETTAIPTKQAIKLMIFSGEDHKTY